MSIGWRGPAVWLAAWCALAPMVARAEPITLQYAGVISSSMLDELMPGTPASWSATYDPARPSGTLSNMVLYRLMFHAMTVGPRSLDVARELTLYTNPGTGLFFAESSLYSAVAATGDVWELGVKRASHFGWYANDAQSTASAELVFCEKQPETPACGPWAGTVRLAATSITRTTATAAPESVPEPEIWLLLTLGVGLQAFRRRTASRALRSSGGSSDSQRRNIERGSV